MAHPWRLTVDRCALKSVSNSQSSASHSVGACRTLVRLGLPPPTYPTAVATSALVSVVPVGKSLAPTHHTFLTFSSTKRRGRIAYSSPRRTSNPLSHASTSLLSPDCYLRAIGPSTTATLRSKVDAITVTSEYRGVACHICPRASEYQCLRTIRST